MGDFKTLFGPLLASVVRGIIWAGIGWLGITIEEGKVETAAGVIAAIGLAGLSLLWSYLSKKALLNTTPPAQNGGGK